MIKLSKSKYSIQRPAIKQWLDLIEKNNRVLLDEISHITLVTMCPIIIVIEFIMEIKGRTPELLLLQGKCKSFYGVEEIEE